MTPQFQWKCLEQIHTSSTIKGVKEKVLVTEELPAELYMYVLHRIRSNKVFVTTIESFGFV